MRGWGKGLLFAVGIIGLLFLIQFQFVSDESLSGQLPLSGKVIVLDPGHGGVDGGAVSKAGVLEKDITLAISLELRDYLQEAGALVLMTREEDRDLANEGTKRIRHRKTEDLKRRAEIINGSGSDLFVSIHLNAIGSSRWSGAQVFYQRAIPENKRLAKFVQDEISRNLENTSRLAKAIHHVYILKEADIPGVLVEAGFLSHPGEAEMLNTKEYQQQMAASIYQGILRFHTDEEELKTEYE